MVNTLDFVKVECRGSGEGLVTRNLIIEKLFSLLHLIHLESAAKLHFKLLIRCFCKPHHLDFMGDEAHNKANW